MKNEQDLFFEEIYENILELFPEFATRAGDHRYDHLLCDPSPAGHARYEETVRAFLARLRKVDPGSLTQRHRTSWELARIWLESEVEGFAFDYHLLLLLDPLQGFQISIPNLLNDMPFESADDYGRCLERLGKVARFIDRVLEGSREGLRVGAIQARPAVEKVLIQLDLQLRMAPEEHPFFTPFTKFPPQVGEEARAGLRSAALKTIERDAYPALRRFREHLEKEYLPRARDDAGIWSVPNGRDLYAWLVRQTTTTFLTPDEIHGIGISEVERIRAEMETAKRATGQDIALESFFSYLREEPRFYFERAEDLLSGYRDIAKKVDAELPRFFGTLPRTPYGILPVPEYAAAANTSAYYQPPPADGSRPGYFYANTHDLSSRPRFEMEALTFHESVPGHHLQHALQIELRSLPEFRTRWLAFTAYVEGWALYAEKLAKEMGFYTDPLSEFGRLTFEMWRACRLVVDTGIHHLRWRRDQSIEYMTARSSLTRLNIESEVDRYIVWPGQALAYKIGELKIQELRGLSEEALGEKFNLKEFHDTLLEEGSLPLDILEGKMKRWIRARKRAKA